MPMFGFGGTNGRQIMPRVQLPTLPPKLKAWNKGRLIRQKWPLVPKRVWSIRARLVLSGNMRDVAVFNVAIDSKLRGCDLVSRARNSWQRRLRAHHNQCCTAFSGQIKVES